MTITFRPATTDDSDRQFIVSSWSISYKTSHSAGIIQADDWAAIMRPQITKLLDRPDMRVTLAAAANDRDFFYGWIAADTSMAVPVVAYIYVKEPYRRKGIARGLFKAAGVDPMRPFVYSCKTGIVSKLSSKIPLARFNNNEVRYAKDARRHP